MLLDEKEIPNEDGVIIALEIAQQNEDIFECQALGIVGANLEVLY